VSTPTVLVTPPNVVRWSVLVQRLDSATPLIEVDADQVCATASIGKVLLLITVAERIESGLLGAEAPLSRSDVDPVADSGLWQHLGVEQLSVSDVCSLVGATSDNLATNVLVSLVGLEQVAETGQRLGMTQTALNDIVRDNRLSEHPAALSSGSARDLVRLCRVLDEADGVSRGASDKVTGWLSTNTDLSMVASAFSLDPLAHVDVDRGIELWNKTGTNDGVRCDIGVVRQGAINVAYAALANWTPQGPADPTRDDVLTSMRNIGKVIRSSMGSTPAR
jgi:beta-lactamase class A